MKVRNWIERINRQETEIGIEEDKTGDKNDQVKQEKEDGEVDTTSGVQTLTVTETRQRRERSDKGKVTITARDEVVLKWIGEQYAVRLDHLQVLLGRDAQGQTQAEGQVSADTARRVVTRWVRAGWAVRRRVFHREPEWVWLTPSGMRLAGLEYRALEPSVTLLKHTYEVNKIRLRFDALYGDEAVWRSERQIKAIRQRNQDAHYADAEVEIRGRTIGLEIERTAKRPIVLRSILAGLVREYQGVWYLVAPDAMSGVQRAVRDLPSDKRKIVRVYDLETISEIKP